MKNNTFRFLVVQIISLLSISAYASSPDDGDNFYVFTNGNKTKVTYSLDKLDKIVFGDQTMSVWANNKCDDYAYSSISLLTFKESVVETLGVDIVESPIRGITVRYDRPNGMVYVLSERPLSGVVIYDVQGKTISKHLGNGQEIRCSLATAPSGVYLVKVLDKDMGKTVKIAK